MIFYGNISSLITIVKLSVFQTTEKKTSKDFHNGIKHIVNEILSDLYLLNVNIKLSNQNKRKNSVWKQNLKIAKLMLVVVAPQL